MREALNHAAGILQSAVDDGWPFDSSLSAANTVGGWEDDDCGRVAGAMSEIAGRLGKRFAGYVLADVRRRRAAAALKGSRKG